MQALKKLPPKWKLLIIFIFKNLFILQKCKNLFILLYRDFVDKIDEICVVQNFLEWGVRNALRSDKKFETSKDHNFSTKAH